MIFWKVPVPNETDTLSQTLVRSDPNRVFVTTKWEHTSEYIITARLILKTEDIQDNVSSEAELGGGWRRSRWLTKVDEQQ